MCSWIYEDALPVTCRYLARLVALADEMGLRGPYSDLTSY
jgi:hypothetical protein